MTEPDIMPPEDQPKRPPEFSDEIFQQICDRMAGGEGLRKVCEDPQMPSRQTFLRWIEKDTGRQAQYTAAREALMDWYSEEILAIAWDDSKDTIKRPDKPDLCNHEWIARSRLKVDTLKFLMAKLHPRRYGDKLTPEADDAKTEALKISWQQPGFNQIELVGVRPTVDDLMKAVDGRTRSAYPESQAKDPERPAEPPRQIAYQPTPPPADLSPEAWSAIARVSDLIELIAPGGETPEHVFGLIEGFLRSHYVQAA